MIIPNINDLRKRSSITPTIQKVWLNSMRTKPPYSYQPFEQIITNVYIPGRMLRSFEIAEERGRIDKSVIIGKEIEKYMEGFNSGYSEFKSTVTDIIAHKERIFDVLKSFRYGERPIKWIRTSNKIITRELDLHAQGKRKKYIQVERHEVKILPHEVKQYGEMVGRLYCAWCIIVENQKVFEPLFINTFTQKETVKKQNDYSHKSIAIAYCILGIPITTENAQEILSRHSQLKSFKKLLGTRISKPSQLTLLSENKSADGKHLKALRSAKQLLSGMKNKTAIKAIDTVIAAFQNHYDKFY